MVAIGEPSVRISAKQSGVQGGASVPAGNCGAGTGVRLQVSCEDGTDMPRRVTGYEEKSSNLEAIGCAEHREVQISGSLPCGGLLVRICSHSLGRLQPATGGNPDSRSQQGRRH